MIATLAWLLTVASIVWQHDIFGCSMVGIVAVMSIVVVGTVGSRMAKRSMDDPGAMTLEELEQKMSDEAW